MQSWAHHRRRSHGPTIDLEPRRYPNDAYEIVVCGARGRLTAMLGIPHDPDAAWGFCDNVPDDLTERLLEIGEEEEDAELLERTIGWYYLWRLATELMDDLEYGRVAAVRSIDEFVIRLLERAEGHAAPPPVTYLPLVMQ
jgi:hypothetical protein